MSDLKTQSLLVLLSDEEVAGIAGSRIHPMRIPQNGALPAVVYQQVANSPVNSMDGDSGLDNVRMQFTCWAKTYAGAMTLAAALRRTISSSPTLKALTAMELDTEDQETRHFGVITDFYMWSRFSPDIISILAKFLRIPFVGGVITTEVDLPSPIADEGFYLIVLNGRIAQETVEYLINSERNKITFVNPLVGGDFKDEGIIIYQPSV